MAKKIGVILSGCGVYDGAEIHESVLTLEPMGAEHVACAVKELAVDRERKLVSTPAYMLGKRISEVAEGLDKAVGAVEMA
jgi:enhancing lycopene biosynthesis protein 2